MCTVSSSQAKIVQLAPSSASFFYAHGSFLLSARMTQSTAEYQRLFISHTHMLAFSLVHPNQTNSRTPLLVTRFSSSNMFDSDVVSTSLKLCSRKFEFKTSHQQISRTPVELISFFISIKHFTMPTAISVARNMN